MALVSTHTEATLAAWMVEELSDVASLLGWVLQSHVQPAIDRTLRAYGVTTIVDADDAVKLESLAAIQAWSMACKALASRYNTEADGLRTDREALHKHALLMLSQAKADAIAAGYIFTTGAMSGAAANEASW